MKVSASYPPTNVPALSLRHCIHQRTTAPKTRLRRRRQPERHFLAVRILGGRVCGRHDHWTARPKGSTRQSSRIPNTSPRCHPLRLVHQASNRMGRSELISTFCSAANDNNSFPRFDSVDCRTGSNIFDVSMSKQCRQAGQQRGRFSINNNNSLRLWPDIVVLCTLASRARQQARMSSKSGKGNFASCGG